MTSKDEALPRLVSEDLLSQSGMRAPKRPKQLRNGDVNWEAFKNSANINLRKIQSNMFNYNLQSQEGFNEVIDQIENAIYNTGLQCRISRKRNPEKVSENSVQLTNAQSRKELLGKKSKNGTIF